MYSSEDLERFYFQYQCEALPHGESRKHSTAILSLYNISLTFAITFINKYMATSSKDIESLWKRYSAEGVH